MTGISNRKKSSRDKTPPEAVLVLGPGHGALKAANDVAQSGIPLVWVTKARHFLELPEGSDTFREWPEDLNFQFRPLSLRVTRHPLVTALSRARITAIEKMRHGYRVSIQQDPQFIDYDLCTGCRKCMEVCPLNGGEHPPITRTPPYFPSRALELEKRELSPCRLSCPLGVNVQAYMALTAEDRFAEALEVIRQDNPLPGVCGRVCHHPCEEVCRRAELDQPLAIRDIKRFLFDYEAEHDQPRHPKPVYRSDGARVAVIGSGPAGLTAAHFLNQAGFKVTIYESLPEPGGMLRVGINSFRLPRKTLEAEIKAIADSGIKIKTGKAVRSLEKLFNQGFRAVLVATGAHADLRLNIPGEDLGGVWPCVRFLAEMNTGGECGVGPRTVVIGGGNSAMDAARCALRLGAEEVVIVAIEQESELPAHRAEIVAAGEEGVQFKLGVAPVAFEGIDRVERIICRPAHWEFPAAGVPRIVFDSADVFVLDADTVIVAIGQKPHLEEAGLDKEVKTGSGGRLIVDENSRASLPGVFAAGDVVTGPSTVIGSMAAGRRAAGRIIEYLTGEPSPFVELTEASRGVGPVVEISEDIPKQPRQAMAERQPQKRCRDFDEIDFGFTVEQAAAEAKRCLQCGVCSECRICESVCADIGAINHFRSARTMEITSPAVIVADEEEIPAGIDIPDDILYKATDFVNALDMMDVLVAGGAAAGKVMGEAGRLRVVSIPKNVEPPEWPDEERFGFFLCTCNGTMAPAGALRRIFNLAESMPGIQHCEMIVSACHPQGAARIARAVREHGLSRVIMASCVCCPLEFHCISCTDQRSRSKILLFESHGLARSRFEMINIRDHLLGGELDEDIIVEKAGGLLRSAFIRSKFMGPLRYGITEIGNRILVLGGSEAGVSCAMNLAHQGFSVRLVHRCQLLGERIPAQILKRPTARGLDASIGQVEQAEVVEIQGNLGNFTVIANEGGHRRRWKADIVCLTDTNILPLAVQEDIADLKRLYRHDFSFFRTPQIGLYQVIPKTLTRVNAFEAGAALAAEVATSAAMAFLKDYQLSPRVDPERCRGCGRCVETCPYDAVRLVANEDGTYTAEVLYYNCSGCGGCVGRCPVTALDMPYFSNQVLKELLVGIFGKE